MTARRRTRAHPARQSGQAVIELVGFVFLTLLVTVLCVQALLAVQAASAAQEAARNGARALSLGQDWRRVVAESLPGWARAQAVDGGTDGDTARVRVAVRVPIGVRSITSADLHFSRSAEMPVKEEPWP